jgi:hypothetical protein
MAGTSVDGRVLASRADSGSAVALDVLLSTSDTPTIVSRTAQAQVAMLTYGELAMAIHASGKPLSRKMTVSQAADLAAEGLSRWGLATVRNWAEQDRRSNLDMTEGRVTNRAWRVSHRQTWSSDRRAQDAHDLAYKVQTAHRLAVAA